MIMGGNFKFLLLSLLFAYLCLIMFLQFQVKTKLKGHQKKITGLAFSQSLNVLVSSGADAQVCRMNNIDALGLCFGMYFLQIVEE